MVHVVPHESRDEIVGVIVVWLHPDLNRVPCITTSSREVCRLQLVIQEPISSSLVNEDMRLGS